MQHFVLQTRLPPKGDLICTLSPEFQQSSVSTIKESVRKGNLVCEKTTAPTIGNSHYCYNQEVISQPELCHQAIHSMFGMTQWKMRMPQYISEKLLSQPRKFKTQLSSICRP
jgi:hypothetical protein